MYSLGKKATALSSASETARQKPRVITPPYDPYFLIKEIIHYIMDENPNNYNQIVMTINDHIGSLRQIPNKENILNLLRHLTEGLDETPSGVGGKKQSHQRRKNHKRWNKRSNKKSRMMKKSKMMKISRKINRDKNIKKQHHTRRQNKRMIGGIYSIYKNERLNEKSVNELLSNNENLNDGKPLYTFNAEKKSHGMLKKNWQLRQFKIYKILDNNQNIERHILIYYYPSEATQSASPDNDVMRGAIFMDMIDYNRYERAHIIQDDDNILKIRSSQIVDTIIDDIKISKRNMRDWKQKQKREKVSYPQEDNPPIAGH